MTKLGPDLNGADSDGDLAEDSEAAAEGEDAYAEESDSDEELQCYGRRDSETHSSEEEREDEAAGIGVEGDAEVPPDQGQPNKEANVLTHFLW